MALNIFFSHGSKDHEWVEDIAAKLQNDLLKVYFYERDREPGQLITDKIKRALDQCDILIVLLTRRSHAAAFVQQEIGYAEAKGKLVIPLVEKGVSSRSLGMLYGREPVPFNRDAVDETIQELTSFLLRHVSKQQANSKGLTQEQFRDGVLALVLLLLAGFLLYAAVKA